MNLSVLMNSNNYTKADSYKLLCLLFISTDVLKLERYNSYSDSFVIDPIPLQLFSHFKQQFVDLFYSINIFLCRFPSNPVKKTLLVCVHESMKVLHYMKSSCPSSPLIFAVESYIINLC